MTLFTNLHSRSHPQYTSHHREIPLRRALEGEKKGREKERNKRQRAKCRNAEDRITNAKHLVTLCFVELKMPTHCKLKWSISLGFQKELLMTLKVFATHFTIITH